MWSRPEGLLAVAARLGRLPLCTAFDFKQRVEQGVRPSTIMVSAPLGCLLSGFSRM